MRRPVKFSIFCILILLLAKTGVASDVVNVFALNSRVIVIHFDDGFVRYHKKGETRQTEWVIAEPLDILKAANAGNYEISGGDGFYKTPQKPASVSRKSKGTEFTWLCTNYSSSVGCVNSVPDHVKEHWIYLHLQQPLQMGNNYTITTRDVAGNGTNWPLDFTLAGNRSEAVHVNLVGYDPVAPEKMGYVYHWAGQNGGIDFSSYSGKNFYLINTKTGEKVFSGGLRFRKSKSNKETYQNDTPNQNFIGADVYECDFSSFKTEGEYILAVEDIGCSFSFRIKKDIYRLPFYTSIRGLFHNRSGIALEEPFTEYVRPAPHNPKITPGFAGKLKYTTSRFIDWTNIDNSSADKKAIEDGIVGPVDTWGWYQDAGDWDGYVSHLKIPAMLMLTWEAAPEKFADGELNLPEGKNQVPDIIDEARWLIRFLHRTRHEILEKGYGTGGVGSRVAPDWFGHAAEGTPSYLDNGQWIISGEDPFTTYFYAGLAAHYALVLNRIGIQDSEGIDWKKEAVEAFNWAANNTLPKDSDPSKVHNFKITNFKMYAAATLFRLTGEAVYKNEVLSCGSNITLNTIIDEDQKWGVYALVTGKENDFDDTEFMAKIKGAVIASADDKYKSAELRACRYGGNMYFPMLVGQATTPMVFEIMMGHFLSREFQPAKTQNYLAALFTTADYFLGSNPLNMSYVTHLGVRYPERVLHIDSWYNSIGDMVPGITPYGPWRDQGSGATGPWDVRWPYKTLFPEGINNWPGHERWYNNYTTPLNAEFTVHQNTVLSAVVYGYLCNVPDGTFKPNKRPEVGIIAPIQNESLKGDILIKPAISDPDGMEDIAWIEYYENWHKIGQSNTYPFEFIWKNAPYGTARLTAKAVDKSGFSAFADTVEITVAPMEYNVKVMVSDSISGAAIEGVKVQIGNRTESTNASGITGFDKTSGWLSITMEHPKYFSKTTGLFSLYSDTTLRYLLIPKKNKIRLVIADQYNGVTFPGVPVQFNGIEKITDSSGEVNFESYNGNFPFFIEKYAFERKEGNLQVNSDTIIYIELKRLSAELKFDLKEDGIPVNDAKVILNSTDSLVSSFLGIAKFSNLTVPQTIHYRVNKPGFTDQAGTFTLETDTTINIKMKANPVGIRGGENLADFSIFPNPVLNTLKLVPAEKISQICVYNVSGNNVQFSGTNPIDVTGLQPGIYILEALLEGNRVEKRKFIKLESFAR